MVGLTGSERRELARRIDEETRRRELPRIRERVERDRLDVRIVIDRDDLPIGPGDRTGPPPPPPAVPPPLPQTGSCKTEGCPHDRNSEHRVGIFAGLCEEVCIPERRRQASEAASRGHRDRAEREAKQRAEAARMNGSSEHGQRDDADEAAYLLTLLLRLRDDAIAVEDTVDVDTEATELFRSLLHDRLSTLPDKAVRDALLNHLTPPGGDG